MIRQRSNRSVNQDYNRDDDDVIIPNRMADESLAKEKCDDEGARVSDHLKTITKDLTYFAG